MMAVRRSKKWNVINFQKWCSLFCKLRHFVGLFLNNFDTPVNGRPPLFALTVFIRWRLLFLTLSWSINTKSMVYCNRLHHRISIPAYAIEQQWWQLGVSKNEMSLMSVIYKMMLVLYQSGVISGYISNIYWHASKWSSISFSHWQYPSDREFSFPRFVGLLILSLWFTLE
jgi:hypothetical protein